jgi:hypothetical protein
MIIYKDQIFCKFYNDCINGKSCNKAFTEKERINADEWWATFNLNGGAPVSFYAEKPDCYIQKKSNQI